MIHSQKRFIPNRN